MKELMIVIVGCLMAFVILDKFGIFGATYYKTVTGRVFQVEIDWSLMSKPIE